MAEEKPADQYDLGDTDLYPRQEVEPYVAPSPQSEGTVERPRNPDGTFAAFEVPKAPPEPPAHQYLIDQAAELGFKASDLEGMSPAAISRAIFATLKNQAAFRAQQADARTIQEAATPQRPPAVPAKDEFAEAMGSELHANLDPGLVGLLRSQHDEIKRLKAEHSLSKQQEMQREYTRGAQLLDDHFEALGPEYERIFGKGPAGELGETGAASLKRRLMVLGECGVNTNNVTPKSFAKIKAAVELLYLAPQKAATAVDPYAATGTPRVTAEQWNGAGLARPTQRNGAAEPKGDAKAVANLERKMADAGMLGDNDVLDGLLGE